MQNDLKTQGAIKLSNVRDTISYCYRGREGVAAWPEVCLPCNRILRVASGLRELGHEARIFQGWAKARGLVTLQAPELAASADCGRII